MSFRSSSLFVCVLVATAMLLPVGAQAQILGTIQGFVHDETGAVLPGATVVVADMETGVSRTVLANTEGFYKTPKLQSGRYSITASLEGMQTVRQEGFDLLVGQILDINATLSIAATEEIITVTSESPLVERSRTTAAAYLTEDAIGALPIKGRDFVEWAFFAPTVQRDTSRGFVTMSGQRGIYTDLTLDGVSNKSAFFGYGLGGEATENDGLVVAQESVKELQVVNSAFSPEHGASAGGFINVITKAGTNSVKGSAFLLFRDQGMAEDFPASPLEESRGRTEDTPRDEFERTNWGLSVGGPIKRDKAHYFITYDQTARSDPFEEDLETIGAYDAILLRAETEPEFAALVEGYSPNPDGTASGIFTRKVDNLILLGKLSYQFNDSHASYFRVNYTDFQRDSTWKDEESEKLEETVSGLISLTSVFGTNMVNEARLLYGTDDLTRLSKRVGEPIEAQIRFRDRSIGRDAVGKFDFLPIFAEESKLQFQDSFSYLFNNHDLKFGIDYSEDSLAQLFAGSLDGRYDFNSLDAFLLNVAVNARIWFGDTTFPNYDEVQVLFALYAQDQWRVNENLTISYGLRYGSTDNPDGLTHVFPQASEIPDDDHIAPRLGFAWSPTAKSVVRGGAGHFYGRTPTLLFASQVQQPGIFPFLGRINVGPLDVGYVPLGTPIDNENPPEDAPNSPAFIDPSFRDQRTLRFNLGYERQFAQAWKAGVDLVYAEGDRLQSNVELNRTGTLDEFGRMAWSSTRANPEFNEIFNRQSIGESEYKAITLSLERRYSGRYALQAHYTYSKDEDTDSNERSATGVTVSSYVPDAFTPAMTSADTQYDWGLSSRDVEHRLVAFGAVDLPLRFRIGGGYTYRSGRPWTSVDDGVDFAYCGFGQLGFNCNDVQAVVNGQRVGRNTNRNDDVEHQINLRFSKFFGFGDRYDLELFFEVFNLLNDNSFAVGDSQRDPTDSEFGIPDNLITEPRELQVGLRFLF